MNPSLHLEQDNLSALQSQPAPFVTLGEALLRESPLYPARPENAQTVHLNIGGSELAVAVLLARLGVSSAFVTRLPANPYGWQARQTAQAHGVDMRFSVWADKYDLMGRYLYEAGVPPRPAQWWYQRKHSAASRLSAGMVDWASAMKNCQFFHTSGISLGLASHSAYADNPLLSAVEEAFANKPPICWLGLDFNYRAALWSVEDCTATLEPLLSDHVDILVASPHDMARHFELGLGRLSADEVLDGLPIDLSDEALQELCQRVLDRFGLQIVALTLRRHDAQGQHFWESAAMNRDGAFYRSPQARPFQTLDRMGGGDAWVGGFYYGLLTGGLGQGGLTKGVSVGDACARLQHTLPHDLPLFSKAELQALLDSDAHHNAQRGRP